MESRVARSKAVRIEDAFEKAMCAIDGTGFDWSDMAEGEIQANIDLMDCSDSNDTSFKASTYKRGLSIFEGKILKYKESEVLFSEEIALLKRSVDQQPLRHSISLEEFKQPEVNEYGPRDSSLKPTTGCDKELDNSKENTDDSLKQQQKTDSSSVKSPLKDDVEPIPKVKIKLLYLLLLKKEFVKPETPAGGQLRSVNTGRPFSTARSFNTVRPSYTAHPKSTVHCARPRTYFQNQAQSTVQRPLYKRTALTKRSYNQNVNTGRQNVNTGRQNVNTVRARGFNAVKPSACWVWKPIKPNGGNHLGFFNKYNYIDARRADTKITGKGTIKTDKLDFDDVYFVKELKFNLFSVSQMCDKKNYVLFTDSEFPKDGLTCLVAKATSEESMLWHRRLGHVNFKNINKLVKENLVRDLPLKRFENDQTCVACLKGKQHRASLDFIGFFLFKNPKDETSEILKNPLSRGKKVLKRRIRVARTPQQNGVAERKNRTLIEAARTMLADSKLPTTFWAEAVSTACYVQNRVLIVKPYNKTPYELFRDKLGKFDVKSDEKVSSLLDIPQSSKAFRYIFSTRSSKSRLDQDWIAMPIWKDASYFGDASPNIVDDSHIEDKDALHDEDDTTEESHDGSNLQNNGTADQQINTARQEVNTGSREVSTALPEVNTATPEDLVGPSSASEDSHMEDQEIELGNIPQSYAVPTTPHTRIHKDHPIEHVIGDVQSSVQTRRMKTSYSEKGFLSAIYEGKTHQDLHTCLFVCFLSQEEPKRVSQALRDPAWVEAMQEELLQFKLQKVWILVDLPKGHRAIEEGVDYDEVFAPMARIEAIRLFLAYASYMGFMVYQMDVKSAFLYGQIEEEVYVCQPLGFEDPDHPDKVYKVVKALYGLHQAPRAWYDTLANYLLCNGFERGKIKTLFIKRHKGHVLLFQIYVDDIIFGSTKKELCDEFEKLMKDKFQMSSMGELTFFLGLQDQQKKNGNFISQDKYVHKILIKFKYSDVKSASTPTDLEKPLVQDGDAADVDEHLYRSMIGSLMYLTTSMPDIMFTVCACASFQVSPKSSHLLAVKRIFRYLKGKPSGLWYFKDSPLELVAYTDSDNAGATQDRKSTTGHSEYVAAASCCGQVLWIQNQLLDYGYNFMDTVIYIDNTSTICIIENPVQHSKTKHIEIRHHFIRDCNAKKLIQMAKIDTQHNVADLLTKGFDAGRFQYLVSSIGMLNP
ncbi:putative ribonuclease H-like domain-containing protein [Tanacetum coccineum]|uniref:Ribonuclease H-like domain-containing protein n=1 Tax=Tanacetum coccineum TaxID=301880 RepID=A0ABQ4X980_9ASTR